MINRLTSVRLMNLGVSESKEIKFSSHNPSTRDFRRSHVSRHERGEMDLLRILTTS